MTNFRKFKKSELNKVIKWTSSKFNIYRKEELINRLLNMEDGEEFEFSCGNYSEGNNNGGYSYTALMFKDKFYLRNNTFNTIYEFIKN